MWRLQPAFQIANVKAQINTRILKEKRGNTFHPVEFYKNYFRVLDFFLPSLCGMEYHISNNVFCVCVQL